MTTPAKQVRLGVLEDLNNYTDAVMHSHGFRRESSRSYGYLRQMPESTQYVGFNGDVNPGYHPGVRFAFHPTISLSFPTVNVIVDRDFAPDPGDVTRDDWTFSQPLEWMIPRDERKVWYAFSREDDQLRLQEIAASFESHCLPFLNQYVSARSLTELYASRDSRLVVDFRGYLYFAAAFVYAGQPKMAMAVLEKHFGKARSRRLFANAFAYVDSLIAS